METIRLGGLNDKNGDKHQSGSVWDKQGIAPTIDTMTGGMREPMIMEESYVIGGLGEKQSNNGRQFFQQDRVYQMGRTSLCIPSQIPDGSYKYLDVKKIMAIDEQNNNRIAECYPLNTMDDGLCRTIKTQYAQTSVQNFESQGTFGATGCVQKIKIRQATEQGFAECEIGGVCDLNYEKSETRRGRVIEDGKICPTLKTENIPEVIELGNPKFYNFLYEINGEVYLIRIRKLTPNECWRLMGFRDEDFKKAEKKNSNSQLYKQAGNSICTPCLMGIFSQLGLKGVKKWNDMEEMEIHHMIERSLNDTRRNEDKDFSRYGCESLHENDT